MQYSVEAITLTTIKYGDSSLILACFTRQYGFQSYMLKGILSSRNNKRISRSLFEPLNLLELEVPKNSKDRLGYIREAKLHYPYQSIPFDLRKKSLLFFLAEVISQVVKEEQEINLGLYDFLKTRLLWLDTEDQVGLFHIKMMIDLTKFIGFYPNLTKINAPFFDLKTGCMGSTKTHPDFLEGKLKDYWINLFGAKFDAIENIRLSKDEKSDLLKYVVRYFQLHLQQFKPPKSTEILNEVFK